MKATGQQMNRGKKAALIINGLFCFSLGLNYIQEVIGCYGSGSTFVILIFLSIILFAISVILSALHLAQSLFEWFIQKRPSSIFWNMLAAIPVFFVFVYLFLNCGYIKNLMDK